MWSVSQYSWYYSVREILEEAVLQCRIIAVLCASVQDIITDTLSCLILIVVKSQQFFWQPKAPIIIIIIIIIII
jgi:hypothetical protein